MITWSHLKIQPILIQFNVDVTDQAGETRSANKSVSVAVFPYSYAWNLNEVWISQNWRRSISVPPQQKGKRLKQKAPLLFLNWCNQSMDETKMLGCSNNPKYEQR